MKAALAAVPLLAGVASAGQILFCNTQSCDGSCSFQSPAGNGACIQLGGIQSAKATQVDFGCSCESGTPYLMGMSLNGH